MNFNGRFGIFSARDKEYINLSLNVNQEGKKKDTLIPNANRITLQKVQILKQEK